MKPSLVADDQAGLAGVQPARTSSLAFTKETVKSLLFLSPYAALYYSRYTKAGSLYYTDDCFAYAFLPVRGNHTVVLKEKGIPKGLDQLNCIEGSGPLPNTGYTITVVSQVSVSLST